MANQHVNKVAVNGKTVLDLSGDTVYPGMLAKGITAHDKSGAKITGTLQVPASEERTVELSMPSGNQVILPTSGKVMRKVTVQKPTTLLPGNIKKGVVIGGVTGTLEASSSGGAKETWVLNESIAPLMDGGTSGAVTYSTDFTSNNNTFNSIKHTESTAAVLYYNDILVFGGKPIAIWKNQAYRKITFSVPPSGNLLTWLQTNGVKQPDDTAVQDTKALTITSNGTVSVTPDAPYDALKKVDVTVDVVADVPLVTVTFKATKFGEEINSPGADEIDEMRRIIISAFVDGNISLANMYGFSEQWGGMVFPFDVVVPQGSSVTICDNSSMGGGVRATNALVANSSTECIKRVFTVYNITDGATITIDVT